ncbi:MAG TPA: fused MFS/spermidine synthase [Caulobacteraceae bacterium]|nr:fused MFS/spermidine synthase [Caulobacteraceae bacterium]
MTDVAVPAAPRTPVAPILFAVAIFTSAALVFTVQPMIAKMILPKLGGSAAVWNTSMVFFQAALLAGYGYAHALQRVSSLRTQVAIHLGLLALAALFLPLHVSGALGDPRPDAPIAWLLGVLALSVGAPFAALSATAPLLQAWYARVRAGEPDAKNPYVLYAASNLGSFIALLAYPIVLEPLLRLHEQTLAWTIGYGLFAALVVGLAALAWSRREQGADAAPLERTAPVAWREKLIWVLLAAAPSSLMLGVTTHLATDVASAPFLWVAPLALYLLTFVVAFSDKPAIPLKLTLPIQAGLIAPCVVLLPFSTGNWGMIFALHLATFFFTALMCHQLLAGRRPPPDRLTEFYLLLSLGGVLGGAFNALLAPVIFDVVREYPLVLLLVLLARPWGQGRIPTWTWYWVVTALVMALIPQGLFALMRAWPEWIREGALAGVFTWAGIERASQWLLAAGAFCAFFLRKRALLMLGVLAMLTLSAHSVAGRYDWVDDARSFFGVLRVARYQDPTYGEIRMLLHGTTLHGAQIAAPENRCAPILYYASTTPLGQALITVQGRKPAADIGVVGLGTGSIAAYKRMSDALTYYEIDPLVERFARDPRRFSYLDGCAKGSPVGVVLGDARLTLAREPAGKFDLLVVDAFSSDSVPTHLLTVEALKGYLRVLKPDGVVVLHLSNRNLEITTPAIATAKAAGAPVLHQVYFEQDRGSEMLEASTEALVIGKSRAALEPFLADGRWKIPSPSRTRPWTDDYTNLIGALWRDLTAEPKAAS